MQWVIRLSFASFFFLYKSCTMSFKKLHPVAARLGAYKAHDHIPVLLQQKNISIAFIDFLCCFL